MKVEKPKRFNEMIEIAKKLSNEFPQVRVDLYQVDEKIYFGELTFCHSGGGQKFKPEKFNESIGELINM